MSAQSNCNPETMKHLILNSREPVLFKNFLNWGLLKWTLTEWENLIKNEQLKFRCGVNSFTKQPQWERTTVEKFATFEDFLLFTKTKPENWMYFDYKYLRQWFDGIQELKNNINWSIFGFPELTSEDSTIWIGSEGAHTPCHIDTYGCNLVAQIYGRKQWILFPPKENLKPTRIPYEESSIYSKLNFFSPNVEDFKGIHNCRKIILEPGDVLFVPNKWWHYVENLDTAISVNVWLPLPTDDDERLKESLIQLFITQITKNLNKEAKEVILNPNSDEEIENNTLNASLELIIQCKNALKKSYQTCSIEQVNIKEKVLDSDEYFKKCLFLHKIPKLSSEEFHQFLQKQGSRFKCEETERKCVFDDLVEIVNAFADSDVVLLIKNKLLE